MEDLERQLEEMEVLAAIYPEEMTVDAGRVESAKKLLDKAGDTSSAASAEPPLPRLAFTVRLARLARLAPGGRLTHVRPCITVELPHAYPEAAPPLVTRTSGLDAGLLDLVRARLDDHAGEESTMQLIMAINEQIQTLNEATAQNYEREVEMKETKILRVSNRKGVDPDAKPVIGRRIINSPYILKPAKIKDLKKIADELELGGYAKVGKPGLIVLEGPDAACDRYCSRLEDRGWKHQKVRGAEREEGPAGGTVDDLRALPHGAGGFEVLPGDATVAELGALCREAGLAGLFFGALGIHDSAGGARDAEGARRKAGKR